MRGHIGHKMEVNHKRHAPTFLSPGTDPHYPLKIRLEGFRSRFERVGKKGDKSLPLPGIELRNPVRSFFFLSLYSPSYPGSTQNNRIVLRIYRNYVSGCSLGVGPYWLQFGWKLQKHPIAWYFARDTNWEEYGKKLVWPHFICIQEFICRKWESQRNSSIKNSPCSIHIRTTEI